LEKYAGSSFGVWQSEQDELDPEDGASILLQTLVITDQLTWQNIPLDFNLVPSDY
jgi:hypothetical protein